VDLTPSSATVQTASDERGANVIEREPSVRKWEGWLQTKTEKHFTDENGGNGGNSLLAKWQGNERQRNGKIRAEQQPELLTAKLASQARH